MLPLLLLAAAAVAPVDYRRGENWLCRPGRADACTSVPGAPNTPAADCFYVYPTVSLDESANSDLDPGIEERGTVLAQLAPFGGACRMYAPLYRQVTLKGLRSLFTATPMAIDRELPYTDVQAAWRDYLAHDNHGRPFVLIGHSQGANVLRRLIVEEIDGKPIAAQLLSAILPGSTIEVPIGKDTGGTFKALPLCRAGSQTGCILSWATFRDTAPPPADTLFGKAAAPGMIAACINPAALAGGTAPLDAILGFPWWRGGVAQYRAPADRAAEPRFQHISGLSGECRSNGAAAWLAVHVDRGGPLTDAAAIGDTEWPAWGWHVVDVAVVQGDLVRLVRRQSAAWRSKR